MSNECSLIYEGTITGIVYYASKDAQQKRLYKEGMSVNTGDYESARYLGDKFLEVNLDNSGTSYIHVANAEITND